MLSRFRFNTLWPALAVFLTAAALSGYVFVQMVVHQVSRSDFAMHLILLKRWVNGEHYLPHPFFHFTTHHVSRLTGDSLEWAAAIVLTFMAAASATIMFLVVRRFDTRELRPLSWSFPAAGFLFLTTPIYLPLVFEYLYLGQLSPTIWHNPTYVFMRPFALGAMVLTLVLIERRWHWPMAVAAVLCALASIVAKPSFIIMFLPGLWCLAALELVRPQRRLKRTAIILLVSITGASMAILAWQFHNRFGAAGKSQIIIDPFAHWIRRSPNIPMSMLVALAFPLAYAVCRPRALLRDRALLLAWIMTLGSMVAYALFRDNEKAGKSNFGWSYCTTQGMLFLFTTVRWIDWRRLGTARLAWWIVTGILMMHAASGVLYYIRVATGAGFK